MQPIIENRTQQDLAAEDVFSWPIWTKETSAFDWNYESREQCYFLEGKVMLETENGTYEFGKGDFVTFPKGMKCVWNVIEPVKKHYKFD